MGYRIYLAPRGKFKDYFRLTLIIFCLIFRFQLEVDQSPLQKLKKNITLLKDLAGVSARGAVSHDP